ncbi:MAG: hypothetical protein V4555_03250 [Acidobacteriota bacterium]
MLNQYVAQWKSRFQKTSRPSNDSMSRRVGHGSTEWSLPTDSERLRQPQDGALDTRARVAEMPHLNRRLINEPEDAWLTGGTRSLSRRLMGLNVTVQATAVRGAVQAAALVRPRAVRAVKAEAVQVA